MTRVVVFSLAGATAVSLFALLIAHNQHTLALTVLFIFALFGLV